MTVRAELCEQDPTRIQIRTDWSLKELTRTIPGCNYNRGADVWQMPVSWSGCLALRSTFRDALEIGPRLTEWALNEKTSRVDPCLQLRELADIPGDPDLYGWQRSGAEFVRVGQRVLIGDDPGSGKTCVAIRGLAAIHAEGQNVFPILVVCPNSMKHTWVREFERWWPGVVCQVISGSASQRRKQFHQAAHVYVINWEGLRGHSRLATYGSIALRRCHEHGGEDPKVTENACQVHERELNRFSWGAVVADEIHRARDPQSQQTRALWGASIASPVKVALTGTPTGGDISDLWPILHWLSPEEWPSKTRWMERMLDTMFNAWGAIIVNGIKPEMEQEFYAGLNPRFRRMPEELVLKHLPPIINDVRDVEMSAKQLKAYREMSEQMIAELDGGLLTVGSSMTKMLRLLQLASSYGEISMVLQDDGTEKAKVTLAEPSSKIDAFINDLPDFGHQQVVVAAVSRQLIELLSARLTKLHIRHGLITGRQDEFERQQAMDQFQAGETQFILLTVGAGGTGITLTAGRYLVRLQRPWSLIDDKQLLHRVRRIGAERHENIIVRDYRTIGTVDQAVVEALDEKGENFESIVRDKDLLRKALQGEL